jgi:four helix bundle protein
MNRRELELRTRKFHVGVITLCRDFPKNAAGLETARQLIRAAGSAGSNYRATVRAKSKADFVYKIEVVLEEVYESHYRLEVIKEAEIKTGTEVDRLIDEANQLTAIFCRDG